MNYKDLYHEIKGSGDPIILLHGFCCSTYSWRFLVPELSKTNKVIAIDLKGFGKSKKPKDKKYSVMDHAELIVDFIIANNLKNITLIGHSLGGGVCLAVNILLNRRKLFLIKNMVLINSIAYKQKKPVLTYFATLPVIADVFIFLFASKIVVKKIVRRAYRNKNIIDDDMLEAYTKPILTTDGQHALIQTARQMIPPDIDDIVKEYDFIKIPTLLICGDKDRVVPFEIAERLTSQLQNSKIVVIENCGHNPHEEKSEKTIELIKDFLN